MLVASPKATVYTLGVTKEKLAAMIQAAIREQPANLVAYKVHSRSSR
jgi:hypothetical protein